MPAPKKTAATPKESVVAPKPRLKPARRTKDAKPAAGNFKSGIALALLIAVAIAGLIAMAVWGSDYKGGDAQAGSPARQFVLQKLDAHVVDVDKRIESIEKRLSALESKTDGARRR